MSVRTWMAGLTDEEDRLAIEYRASRLALFEANVEIDDAERGVLLSVAPMGAHDAPLLYADRIEWLGHVVPLSSGLSAEVRRLRKAVFVPSCEPSESDENRTFQLELRVENPHLGGVFIEQFKSEDERDLKQFCQQVRSEKPNGEAAAAARRDAVEHAERDRDFLAAEAEAAKARVSSLSAGQMLVLKPTGQHRLMRHLQARATAVVTVPRRPALRLKGGARTQQRQTLLRRGSVTSSDARSVLTVTDRASSETSERQYGGHEPASGVGGRRLEDRSRERAEERGRTGLRQ